MPLSEMNERKYKEYVLRLREEIENDVSINSYLRDLIATMRFLMEEGYIKSDTFGFPECVFFISVEWNCKRQWKRKFLSQD